MMRSLEVHYIIFTACASLNTLGFHNKGIKRLIQSIHVFRKLFDPSHFLLVPGLMDSGPNLGGGPGGKHMLQSSRSFYHEFNMYPKLKLDVRSSKQRYLTLQRS